MCGDGDMMEGVGSEAASLAGHLKLSNLCWIYDHNSVTLDGPAKWSYDEDVMTKFVGLGWNVTRVSDANDLVMLGRAYETFLKTNDKPTLIVVDSHIGYGSPNKHDSSDSHGEPLGVEEVKLTKKFYGWPEDAQFLVPDGVYDRFKNGIGKRGGENHAAWTKVYSEYKTKFPELDQQIQTMQKEELPKGLGQGFAELPCRCEGSGDARFFEQGAECAGEEYSLDGRRLGGLGAFEQDESDVRRRGRFLP